jgi:hypothetical protein
MPARAHTSAHAHICAHTHARTHADARKRSRKHAPAHPTSAHARARARTRTSLRSSMCLRSSLCLYSSPISSSWSSCNRNKQTHKQTNKPRSDPPRPAHGHIGHIGPRLLSRISASFHLPNVRALRREELRRDGQARVVERRDLGLGGCNDLPRGTRPACRMQHASVWCATFAKALAPASLLRPGPAPGPARLPRPRPRALG